MEGCTETTTIDGHIITTIFTKRNTVVATRVIVTEEQWEIEYWCKDGKHHREGQPAIIHYEDGKITYQSWYKDGKYHREGQPAIIRYEDGKITYQSWYKDGKQYREIGPTHTRIKDGIIVNRWYDNEAQSGLAIYDEMDYLDVPEDRRLSPTFRQVMRQLPLPVGDAIAWHFKEIWQFVDAD